MHDRAAVLIALALSSLVATAHAERVATVEREPRCAADARCVARELAATLTAPMDAVVLPRLIQFEPGRVRVYSAGRERIQALADQWKKHRSWKVITVEGHAPRARRVTARGSLALRRAERIRGYLLRYGVPKEFVVARAADESGTTERSVGSVDLSIEVCASHHCLRQSDAAGPTR